jgi:predicted ATPase
LERAEIQNIRITSYERSIKYLHVINTASELLNTLGVNLPTTKSEILAELEIELGVYRAKLEKIKIAELIDAPEMINPEIILCMKLLMNITASAYFTNQDLMALICLKMVNLSLEYGKSEVSAHGYVFWGFIAGARLSEYKTGYEFGQLAIQLNEQLNNVNLVSKVCNVFGGLISPWRRHVKKGLPILRNGYLAGVETGDAYGAYNAYNMTLHRILIGDDFSSILEESSKLIEFLKQSKNQEWLGVQKLYQHFILNLQGLTQNKFSFNDEEFDEFQCLQMWQKTDFMTGIAPYNIFKAQTLFLYGDYENALKEIKKVIKF